LFDAILLDVLVISPKYQKLGLGSEILKKTITFAEDLGVDLVLEPESSFVTPLPILNAF
jgi:GNAT superfamily N-acetyltransferase